MFQWEDKYSVGIQSIDNQHREMFMHLNKLLDAMKIGQANTVVNEIILELEKYAHIHFQKEEFFFRQFNYPGTIEHVQEHNTFIQKINLLKAEFKSGKSALSIELLNFLKDWIDHHILVVDMGYSECFRQNGLK